MNLTRAFYFLTCAPPATYNEAILTGEGTVALAKQETDSEKSAPDIDRLIQRLDMLDRRLDSVDSIVSAVAERVMQQPITLNVTCSKCGQKIEIAVLGTAKPGR
jgi:hypothetical protein